MPRGGKRPGAGRKPVPEVVKSSRKPGRPSAYDPALCEEIVVFCRGGHSLTGFAGHIGVCRETISEWARVHPEFSVAVRRAKAAATLAYELDAKRVRARGGGPGTTTMIIFGLKNMAPDDYTDKQAVEHSGPGGGPVQIQKIERVIVDPQGR